MLWLHGGAAIVLLALPFASSRADGTVATYTVTNDTGSPQGFLEVSFDTTDLHDAVVIDNPSLCSPPHVNVVYGNEVYINWDCECVQPSQSVTFTVHTAGATELSKRWFGGGSCPGVIVTPFRVLDLNGDHDGYPDSNETFDLTIGVSNKWPGDLTNVVAHISTKDPKIDCIVTPTVVIGNLSANTDVEAPTPFRLHVHPDADRGGAAVTCNSPGPGGTCSNFVSVPGGCLSDAECRRATYDDYYAQMTVTLSADQFAVQSRPQTVTLDLDLDASNPSGSTTTFAEGFESGFGNLMFENLDANKASNSASDGYRCQYNDPDFPNSLSYGETSCYLGFAAGQSPINDWHIHSTAALDGGRAFLGTRSIHYGKHSVDAGFDTCGLSQLDGIRTKSDIHLAARICQDDAAQDKRSCNSPMDCLPVGGGPCVSASPELSFKHQVSAVDDRYLSMPEGQTADRAVVHAQLAGSTVWQKLHPFENIYNAQGENVFFACTFDPIDDGNNEDSYFDPTDPNRRFGPSSTCYPEFVFSYLGDTSGSFAPGNTGEASDGPSLEGSLGIGTWIESRFDLSRFRGRSIKIRFLFTSLKIVDAVSWEDAFQDPPVPYDDGWYIDDVRVTQTLGATSSIVSLDNADNSALPGNTDGDARGDECDCAPTDAGGFAVPGAVTGPRFGADKATLTWDSAAPAAGSDTVHDVLRGVLNQLPVGTGASEVCLATIQDSTVSDSATPAQASGFWYVVRGRNVCGVGTYGFQTNGAERNSSACP